jgi:hypothetical protein
MPTGGLASLVTSTNPTLMNHLFAHPIANTAHNNASFPLALRTGRLFAGFLNKRDADFNAW